MAKVRVLIVDDSVVIRRMISKVIEADPELEVAGIASNGQIALQKIPQFNPDIITMDIEMPVLNGISTVREIRKTYDKLPIIMFSTLSTKGARATLEALAAGATDYITKPANVGNVTEGLETLQHDLIPKIKAHFPQEQTSRPIIEQRSPARQNQRAKPPKAFCIGSSTGGPNALSKLFADIQYTIPVPTFIVQHMPPVFTKMLADRLDKDSPNRFYEGQEGQIAEPGCVYIAPGGKHMEVVSLNGQTGIRLTENPPENSCRPAVDVLFRSAASTYGGALLAAVLTGMGSDGKRGSEVIKDRGGQILAQDEASSVVWGMPRYIAESGLADKILPLDHIANEITLRLRTPHAIAK
ncbi:MAG: chemotaxis response regulator protein-glutamate methylesterase [Symploca sp. SIO2D2]|nr:chemotaxis response regulator protein-glutamate methylesterase [Symploca sp. SIO2D2]